MKRIAPICTALVLLSVVSTTAEPLPLGIPEYDLVYDRLERQWAMSADKADFQLGPYRLDHIQPDSTPYRWLTSHTDESIWLFGIGNSSLAARKQAATVGLESLRGGVALQPRPWLSIYGHFALDEALARDSTYTGHTWRGLAGDVEQMFAGVKTGGFDGLFGRFSTFWGERRSPLLAPGQALDGLSVGYRYGRLKLTYLITRLDGLSPERDSVSEFENRFLAGHRLDIHAADWLQIGLFETVIFGGPGRTVELTYLNPLLFFHAWQLNEGTDDNTILGGDVSLHPTNNVRLYSQVVVDDFQVDDDKQSDQEPNQIAWLAGGYVADVLPDLDFRLEYSRVNNWTFNQPLERNRYLLNGKPLGAASGNDYDQLTLKGIWWPTATSQLFAEADLLRRGEGRIDADWSAPWLDTDGDYSESFPSGTVERTQRFTIGGKGLVWSHLYVDISGGIELIQNTGHVDGDDRDLPFVNLRFSLLGGRSVRVAE